MSRLYGTRVENFFWPSSRDPQCLEETEGQVFLPSGVINSRTPLRRTFATFRSTLNFGGNFLSKVIESLTTEARWPPHKSQMIWRENFKEKECQTFWAKKVLGKLNQARAWRPWRLQPISNRCGSAAGRFCCSVSSCLRWHLRLLLFLQFYKTEPVKVVKWSWRLTFDSGDPGDISSSLQSLFVILSSKRKVK